MRLKRKFKTTWGWSSHMMLNIIGDSSWMAPPHHQEVGDIHCKSSNGETIDFERPREIFLRVFYYKSKSRIHEEDFIIIKIMAKSISKQW